MVEYAIGNSAEVIRTRWLFSKVFGFDIHNAKDRRDFNTAGLS